jgi:hypothetical protein
MADIIKIKRSDTTATPVSLAAGELAYSEASGNFFYGRISDGTPVKIGGNTDVLKLAGIESGAQVNTVDDVNGKTGSITLDHADITDFDTEVNSLIGAASITDLSDVQGSPSPSQVLTWNAGGYWEPQASPTGVTEFISLNDTPVNFSGSAGRFVKVNSGATALEFVDGIDGGTF